MVVAIEESGGLFAKKHPVKVTGSALPPVPSLPRTAFPEKMHDATLIVPPCLTVVKMIVIPLS
jgi:hypothetical protein